MKKTLGVFCARRLVLPRSEQRRAHPFRRAPARDKKPSKEQLEAHPSALHTCTRNASLQLGSPLQLSPPRRCRSAARCLLATSVTVTTVGKPKLSSSLIAKIAKSFSGRYLYINPCSWSPETHTDQCPRVFVASMLLPRFHKMVLHCR